MLWEAFDRAIELKLFGDRHYGAACFRLRTETVWPADNWPLTAIYANVPQIPPIRILGERPVAGSSAHISPKSITLAPSTQALFVGEFHEFNCGSHFSGLLRFLLICTHIVRCRDHHGNFHAKLTPGVSGRKRR